MNQPRRHVAAPERAALADALMAAGPTAPTLCDGWTALDLAAHVVVRERRVDSLPGLKVPALTPLTERIRLAAVERGLPALVDRLRAGPPPWSPFGLPGVDARANELEMLIHHEDVRRGSGEGPRAEGPGCDDVDTAAWAFLASPLMRMTFSRSGVGVVLARSPRGVEPTGAPIVGQPVTARRARNGEQTVTVTGAPVELLLFATGRQTAARVTLDGPPEAVAALGAHARTM